LTSSNAGAWFGRQARRLAWLGQDVFLGARSVGRIFRHARDADHGVGLALLEGQTWAVRGTLNGYRIRMVNDSGATLDVMLAVCGEAAPGLRFEARRSDRLAGHQASDLYLVTDWLSRFEIAARAPATDPLAFLGVPAHTVPCQLTATLDCGNTVHTLGIAQPLAG
jgi:hypothetical protein